MAMGKAISCFPSSAAPHAWCFVTRKFQSVFLLATTNVAILYQSTSHPYNKTREKHDVKRILLATALIIT